MQLDDFQLLDSLHVNARCDEIRGTAHVPTNHTVLRGHYPGYEVLPGVLQVEMIAQAAGYLVLERVKWSRMPLLASIDRARFRRVIRPGTRVDIVCRLDHDGSGFVRCCGCLEVDGEQAMDAELKLKLIPFPAIAMNEELGRRAKYLLRHANTLPAE
jgi:3-hydroxyacyl-[acyl-carrier-protein] dehydratase